MRCATVPGLMDPVSTVQATMLRSVSMREICSQRDAQACGGAIRHGSLRDPVFLVLLFVVLVRTSQALAGEQQVIAAGPLKPDFNAGPATGREPLPLTTPLFDLPKTYRATDAGAGDAFPLHDFRARRPSLLELGPQGATSDDLPMLHGTSVWQRLAEYRAHGRVRLLTLWEAGGSSVSLQAGRKGEPSLQWTSRSMNHGGASRGVLDPLVSMAGASRSFKAAPRPSAADTAPRPTKPAEAGIAASK